VASGKLRRLGKDLYYHWRRKAGASSGYAARVVHDLISAPGQSGAGRYGDGVRSRVIRVPIVLVGLLVVLVGVWALNSVARIAGNGAQARATVVDIVVVQGPRTEDSDGIQYHPVVEFTADHGEVVSVELNISKKVMGRPAYSVGDSIDIIYNRDTPTMVVVNSFIDRYLMPAIPLFLGLVLLAIGLLGSRKV